jgi:D-alanine--poly(phosphoribitol) ligase subunit 1
MASAWNLGLKFREVAAASASRPALRPPDAEAVTYAELDNLSDRMAGLLYAEGRRPGDVVGIFHDKSALGFAAMLACLKNGLIYTNLDPGSPWERLRKITENCDPAVVINTFVEAPHAGPLTAQGTPMLHVRDSATAEKIRCAAPVDPAGTAAVTGADPAYIMFTSGSTGMPKGAVMSHGNVLNFISWAQDRFQLEAGDVFSNANPIYFDNSVFDFYASLFSGASMVPISADAARDSRRLVEIVNRQKCTIWFSVPSLLVYLLTTRALAQSDFPSVRKIIFGGEGFPKAKLKRLFDLFGDRADLENVYGPTECTCICSAHTIDPSDFADMQSVATLGFLASNFDYEILSDDGPDGPGELFLRGPNVGLGYYNDPDRTAKAFTQNPRHQRFADIGYRTGDLVRRDTLGRLHFVGRADFQVKHMGYRIELEEIEAALAIIPEVKECAVIYRKLAEGLGEIVGFATLTTPMPAEEIIRKVAEIVPPYMVPKRVRVLEDLPKNANGKIDRIVLQSIASQAE